ncbi:DUF397 domain-containing protein [Saccharopolyspora hirsuta]|uniref:DUF397 domain-containing protein n=2 Tax=Saccharopolyspora hirsuta TaxID=1837 RepID=A0A5M7BI85_SACHI|nr:DUF397 domain-containing protein [Saccharopolyspora hirsuta]KAA5829259.1 DUF397 domain-containing protein [Saccharopolyspora hirsuta]
MPLEQPIWRKSSYSGQTGSCVEVADLRGWRKSSHSNGAQNCVEVGWRKSSRSNSQGGMCVEVGRGEEVVGMRDSKLGEASPVLAVSRARWADFVSAVKGGAFGS